MSNPSIGFLNFWEGFNKRVGKIVWDRESVRMACQTAYMAGRLDEGHDLSDRLERLGLEALQQVLPTPGMGSSH